MIRMPYQLTPAQLELQAARKAAKLAKAAEGPVKLKLTPQDIERQRFLKREWLDVKPKAASGSSTDGEGKGKGRSTSIITWNLLAQTLVRRELFPGSDCLKWGDRKPMLLAELEHYASADIVCFQECDRLTDLLPSFPHHDHVKASGPGKLHGLVVLYRSARYRVRATRAIHLDVEEIVPSTNPAADNDQEKRRRRGGSRQTKNVGLIVALEDLEKKTEGIVIATTHLFWHPKFVYERTRQALILLRNIIDFRKEENCEDWPAVIAGDFNTQPAEATYQLLTAPHQTLPQALSDEVAFSRFVHTSVDMIGRAAAVSVPASNPDSTTTSHTGTGTNTPLTQEAGDEEEDEGEGGGEEELPDTDERSIKGTRPARPEDGLPELDRLSGLARSLLPARGCRSAYADVTWTGDASMTYAGRQGFERTFGDEVPGGLEGHGEPAYTCYTPLFKLTLDYLLILPSPTVTATKVLRPGTSEELGQGLPRKGISASDHQAVGCELAW